MSSLGWLVQPAAFPWVALFFGLCIGSFLNVVIHRLPRMMEREWLGQIPEMLEEAEALKGEPARKQVADEVRALTKAALGGRLGLAYPPSRCPACGHRIGALQNIPLLSYLVLRGKCAQCGTRISPAYPAVELIAGVGAFYCAYHFGFGLKAFAAAAFFWCVIALALIDQKTGYLPDDITLPLMWLGLLVNLTGTFVPLADALIGAVAGYLVLWTVNAIFRAVRGMEGMGYGDFKMTAAVAAFLGWRELFMVILLSSFVGLVFGSAQMITARRGLDWKFKFHFGPYIAIAGVIALFWGNEIARRIPMLRPLG